MASNPTALGTAGIRIRKKGQGNNNQNATKRQQGIINQANAGQIQPLTPGSNISSADLQPFTGKGGNVTVNPFTLQPINQKDKRKPVGFISQNLAETGAKEAQEFQFDNLPQNPTPQITPQLQGAASQLLGQGSGLIQQGGQNIQTAVDQLLGTGQRTQELGVTTGQDRARALAELDQFQEQALSPELSPEAREFFQNRADERLAELNTRFDEGGDIANLFDRQRQADIAQLANQGVLDSQTAANTFARRDTDLAALFNQLVGDANELSRGEELQERGDLRETATGFAGLEGQQALGAGSLLASLLGTEADIGSTIGGLGQSSQQIGSALSQLGLSGLGQAGDLGLRGRELEADLQLAETGQRLLGNQLNLQNIQALLNNRTNRQAQKEALRLQQELADQANQGIFGRFF